MIGIWLGWQDSSWSLKIITTIIDINAILCYTREYLNEIGKEK